MNATLRRTLLASALLALFASGCGNDECEAAADCPEAEICVFFSNADSRCMVPCGENDECPEGLVCEEKGSSCEGCENILSVCD